jgi:hypothetical protein
MFNFKGSIALEHMHHAYAKTDGTYDFPNSREGDILKQAKKELEQLLERSDNSDYQILETSDNRKYCQTLGE